MRCFCLQIILFVATLSKIAFELNNSRDSVNYIIVKSFCFLSLLNNIFQIILLNVVSKFDLYNLLEIFSSSEFEDL